MACLLHQWPEMHEYVNHWHSSQQHRKSPVKAQTSINKTDLNDLASVRDMPLSELKLVSISVYKHTKKYVKGGLGEHRHGCVSNKEKAGQCLGYTNLVTGSLSSTWERSIF